MAVVLDEAVGRITAIQLEELFGGRGDAGGERPAGPIVASRMDKESPATAFAAGLILLTLSHVPRVLQPRGSTMLPVSALTRRSMSSPVAWL